MNEPEIYGLAAEFDDPTAFVEAAREAKRRGYRKLDAYSPYAIKDLQEIIPTFNLVPTICLIGGVIGAGTAWFMEYFIAAIVYATNIGGRPLYSWPMFIPILFELTVLFAGVSAFFGTLALCGFPKPHHPMFNVPQFSESTSSRFFLCVQRKDPIFDRELTAEFLSSVDAIGVWEVEDV